MSGKKFFVFKTKSGEFIGHMFKPTENDLMYGLEYKTQHQLKPTPYLQ